jgi:hypothetical protein
MADTRDTVTGMPEPYDEKWASEGQSADKAGRPTVPMFIEMADGSFKKVTECSPAELMAEAASRLMQAKELTEEAQRLTELAQGDVSDGDADG